MLQPDVSIAHQADFKRIGDNEFGTLAGSPPDIHTYYWVSSGGVGADSQDAFGIIDILDRVGHGAAAEGGGQTGHSGGMSEAGTMVHIVGAQHRPGEFLHDVIVLVGAFR